MKVCDTVVIFKNILPYSHSMLMAAIKCAVHKFYLIYFMIQEKTQFLLYDRNIAESHLIFHRRQTIGAPERTSSAGLIINNLICKRR